MDDSRHQPSGAGVPRLARVDRAVHDAVVADAQPMPGRGSSPRLDVEVRRARGQSLQPLLNPGQRHTRPDAPQIALGAPGEDDAMHTQASVAVNLGEDIGRGAHTAGPEIGVGGARCAHELRRVGEYEVLQRVRIDSDHRGHRPSVAGHDRGASGADHLVDDLAGAATQVADADCRHELLRSRMHVQVSYICGEDQARPGAFRGRDEPSSTRRDAESLRPSVHFWRIGRGRASPEARTAKGTLESERDA